MEFFGIQTESAPFQADLAFALAAAREGRRDAATVARLEAQSLDPEVITRGYACWALREIFPINEKPAEYHVDQRHPNASDANSGSITAPWRTIQRSAETVRAGDTVVIHPGLYREWVRPFFGGKPNAYITYTSAPGAERAILTAADIWKNEWREEGKGLFSGPYQRHSWDCPEKWSHPVSGAMHRSEQIIVNGKLLRQVDDRAALEQPETFWTDDEASRVWVHLGESLSPDECKMERGNRQQVFAPAVRGLGFIRVNGLGFLYGCAPEWYGDSRAEIGQRSVVSVHAGHHWLIENNLIEWGNAQGLDVGTGGSYGAESVVPRIGDEVGHHVVRNNLVNHHAVAGIIGTGGVQDIILDGNETSFNGWKGNFEGYEAAGLKLHAADRCIIRHHKAHRNESFGIWLDWDCRRNRVTRCLMTENLAAGFFHEASPGPLLVDGNVILDTRAMPSGDWGDGIYCHDGNHATFYGNYVARSAGYGVRLKVLFGRELNGKPTTAEGNRAFNNILMDNRGAISFHPENALFIDNISEANLIWDKEGRVPLMQLEDGGSGVAWENTAVGRFLGQSGGGNLVLGLTQWSEIFGQDKTSLILPLKSLESCALIQKESVEALEAVFRQLRQPFPEALGKQEEIGILAISDLISVLVPRLKGYEAVRTFWLGPQEALQVWRGERDAVEIEWRGVEGAKLAPIRHRGLVSEKRESEPAPPRVLTIGETTEFDALGQPEIILAPIQSLSASLEKDKIKVAVAANAPAGRYRIVFAQGDSWHLEEVDVAAPLRLHRIETRLVRAQSNHGILTLPVENRSRRAIPVTIEVRLDEETQTVKEELAPESVSRFEFPVKSLAAGLAHLRIETPVQTIVQSEKVSFIVASAGRDWLDGVWHNLAVFPDGIFPAGAPAFILFENNLSARFAVRHDSSGLHLRLEAHDRAHNQNAPDWQLYLEDSVELLLKPRPGAEYRGPFLFHLALHSSDQRQILKFRDRSQTPGSADSPPNLATSQVHRENVVTTYDFHVPWRMLNLSGAPAPTEDPLPIRLSLLLNNNDGYDRHGFQWFFGIFHHAGEDEKMGTIWVA